jgi:hypothetical protein
MGGDHDPPKVLVARLFSLALVVVFVICLNVEFVCADIPDTGQPCIVQPAVSISVVDNTIHNEEIASEQMDSSCSLEITNGHSAQSVSV